MAGAQNSGTVPTIFSIRLIPKDFSKSKNAEIFKIPNIQTLLDDIKTNENKTVCVCLQFKENNKLKSPRYICLKTMYAISQLPDKLKENILTDDEDLDKVSINVQPPSISKYISEGDLPLKGLKNILSLNLRHEGLYSNINDFIDPEDYRQKYGTAKIKISHSQTTSNHSDNSKTKSDSIYNQKEQESTDNTQTKPYVVIMHTEMDFNGNKKHKKPCKQNTKAISDNSSEIPCSAESLAKRKKNLHYTQRHDIRVERYVSSSNLRMSSFDNCGSNKKRPSYALNKYCCNRTKKNCKCLYKIKRSKQVEPCPCLCNKTNTDKIDNHNLSKYLKYEKKIGNIDNFKRDKKYPEYGKGTVNIEGRRYEALVCFTNHEQMKYTECKCNSDAYCRKLSNMKQLSLENGVEILLRHPTKDNKRKLSFKSAHKNKPQVVDDINDDNDVGGGEEKEDKDDEYKKSKLQVLNAARPAKGDTGIETSEIPGFTFKLNKCKQEANKSSELPDESCLIRHQEEQRFQQYEISHQPLTIIMNEPFNTPLRIYEISSTNRKRYLSTQK